MKITECLLKLNATTNTPILVKTIIIIVTTIFNLVKTMILIVKALFNLLVYNGLTVALLPLFWAPINLRLRYESRGGVVDKESVSPILL